MIRLQNHSLPTRYQVLFAPILGFLIIGLMVILRDIKPTYEYASLLILGYALLYVILAQFAYKTEHSLSVNLSLFAPLATFLSLGTLPAVEVAVLGTLFTAIAKVGFLLRSQRIDQRVRFTFDPLSSVFFEGALSLCAVMLGGFFYRLLDGPTPFLLGQDDDCYPLAVVGLAFFTIIFYQIPFLFRVLDVRLFPVRVVMADLVKLITLQLLPAALAVLLAAGYNYQFPSSANIIVAGSIIASALFLRSTQNTQQSLAQRVQELATLNAIGQSLTSSLSPIKLMQRLSGHVQKVIDAPFFAVAQYSSEAKQAVFPFWTMQGEDGKWPDRYEAAIRELCTDVAKTRQPILLCLQRMACLIAAPMIADEHLLGILIVMHPHNDQAYGKAEQVLLSAIASQAANAFRNANLYDDMSEMSDKLKLIYNVSSLIVNTLDLDAVLKTICSIMIDVGYADKTGIFLHEQNGLRLAYSIGLSADYVALFQPQTRPASDNVAENVDNSPNPFLNTQQVGTLAIKDVRTDPRGIGWRSLAEVEGYLSLLTVPLIAGDTTIGFLAAFYVQPHAFDKGELDMMNTLANQVSVIVANARLYQDTRNRANQRTRLVDASRAFNATLDPISIAERVLDELDSVFQSDISAVLLINENDFSGQNKLKPIAQRGNYQWAALEPVGSLLTVIETQNMLTMPITKADVDWLTEMEIHSVDVFPLVLQERTTGLVLIGYRTEHHRGLQDLQFAEALTNQAATALVNAQLFVQIDEALDERLSELSAIETVSRKLAGSLQLEEIIDEVLDAALLITHASTTSAMLTVPSDPEFCTYVDKHSQGVDGLTFNGIIRRDEGVVGEVLRTGSVAWIGDVRTHPEYLSPTLTGMLSELVVPITYKGEILGAINVESSRLDAFTVSHKRFLTTLADHTGIAIANARLFEERQGQIDSLISLRDLSMRLLSANSVKSVLQSLAHYTLLIARARDVQLYLYDRTTDNLTFGTSLWRDGREDVPLGKPTREGRIWQTARTGQMLLTPDSAKEPREDKWLYNLGIGAMARVALKRGDKVFGVMTIAFREPHYFTETDIRTYDLIANQGAIAVENARLFDEVRTARDQMQVILDSARDGMVLVGARGELSLVNPAAERLLNHSLQPYIGQNIMRLLVRIRRTTTDERNMYALTEDIQGTFDDIKRTPNQHTRRTFQLTGANGKIHDLEETSLPVSDNYGNAAGRLIVLRDVSEEKEVERLREEASTLMVHDLRAPLTTVISSLRLMNELIEHKQYEDVMQIGEIALTSSENQMKMIQSLLDIAKADQLDVHPHSLYQLVSSALAPLEVVANEAQIRLINRIPRDFPQVMIDESKLLRVFTNLIDNSVRHTPVKGEVRVDATISTDNDGIAWAKISVIDTGKGIPEELWNHIFEKFFQVPKSALRGYKGAGLGLAYCKRAIMGHGGKIWVGRGPEGGAAFWLTLPLVQQPTKPADTLHSALLPEPLVQ